MSPSDCHAGQRVLYAGRACVVSAIAGDQAVISAGGEFRTVPIFELTPVLTNGQLEAAIRHLGADHQPDPNWQQQVWRWIASDRESPGLVAIGLTVSAVAVGLAVAWLLAWSGC